MRRIYRIPVIIDYSNLAYDRTGKHMVDLINCLGENGKSTVWLREQKLVTSWISGSVAVEISGYCKSVTIGTH